MKNYKNWREVVKRIMFTQGLITEEQEISEDIYKPYFDDGYSPAKAIKEDLGSDAIISFHGYDLMRNCLHKSRMN